MSITSKEMAKMAYQALSEKKSGKYPGHRYQQYFRTRRLFCNR